MTEIVIAYILAVAAAYLLGSISSSIIITKQFSGTDVRSQGSGNAGTTNVLRTAGKLPAILTFAGDILKCIAAILVAMLLAYLFRLSPAAAEYIKYVAAIFCMVGHIFPLFFGFRGGKGVASAAAAALMLDWRVFIIGIGIFILIVLVVRIVSLGSILAGASIPITTFLFQSMEHRPYTAVDTALIAVIALIIIVKHRANIGRLIKGTEPRIKSRK